MSRPNEQRLDAEFPDIKTDIRNAANNSERIFALLRNIEQSASPNKQIAIEYTLQNLWDSIIEKYKDSVLQVSRGVPANTPQVLKDMATLVGKLMKGLDESKKITFQSILRAFFYESYIAPGAKVLELTQPKEVERKFQCFIFCTFLSFIELGVIFTPVDLKNWLDAMLSWCGNDPDTCG